MERFDADKRVNDSIDIEVERCIIELEARKYRTKGDKVSKLDNTLVFRQITLNVQFVLL